MRASTSRIHTCSWPSRAFCDRVLRCVFNVGRLFGRGNSINMMPVMDYVNCKSWMVTCSPPFFHGDYSGSYFLRSLCNYYECRVSPPLSFRKLDERSFRPLVLGKSCLDNLLPTSHFELRRTLLYHRTSIYLPAPNVTARRKCYSSILAPPFG